MLIGICGGICAGKASVASYLIEEHGFKRLSLARPSSSKGPNTEAKKAPKDELYFDDCEQLLDYVTARWRERFVTTDIWDEHALELLLRRPFFILVGVDAPLTVRFERYKQKMLAQPNPQSEPNLADFVARDDEHLYAPRSGLAPLLHRAQLRLLNSSSSLLSLRAALRSLDLTNEERMRPSWDQYFMQLASLAAQRCNCMKRRVGCVLVQERRVISTGYNGTPRGVTNCNEGGCPRCNTAQSAGTALDTCLCLHAEENALLEAGRDRIRQGSTLYCNTCPCLTCSVKIAQVGIREVVYAIGYHVDGKAAEIMREAGVTLRQYSPPAEGLVDLTYDTARVLNAGE
jgi:dCMP deaminase